MATTSPEVIIRLNARRDEAIKNREIESACRYTRMLRRLEIKDGVDIGAYKIR